MLPCRTHVAVQAPGVTCTVIRRRQWTHHRGGSSSARRAQRTWAPESTASPHCPHHVPGDEGLATGSTAMRCQNVSLRALIGISSSSSSARSSRGSRPSVVR